MKSFKSHITENTDAPKDFCFYLSSRNKEEFISKLFVHQNEGGVYKFIDAIREWIVGSGNIEKRFRIEDQLISLIKKCKSRSGWTKFTGKIYRGLRKDIGFLEDGGIKFTGEVIESDGFFSDKAPVNKILRGKMLVGSMTYKSAYQAQSWTTEKKVATRFAAQGEGYGRFSTNDAKLLMECQISADESFNLKPFGKFFGHNEMEIIRLSGNPVNAKVYVYTNEVIRHLLSKRNEKGILVIDEDMAKKIFGAQYKKIIDHPLFVAETKKVYMMMEDEIKSGHLISH